MGTMNKPAAAPARATVKPVHAELRASLFQACQMLDGWIERNVDPKHQAHHKAEVDKLRLVSVNAGEPDERQMVSPALRGSVLSVEQLEWIDPAKELPDSDITMLVWSAEHAGITAWWDAETGSWRDCAHGGLLSDVVAWADPQGPGL